MSPGNVKAAAARLRERVLDSTDWAYIEAGGGDAYLDDDLRLVLEELERLQGVSMTPEEAIAANIVWEFIEPGGVRGSQELADAIVAAIRQEREACARHLEKSQERFPDDHRVRAILRAEAESIRERGTET